MSFVRTAYLTSAVLAATVLGACNKSDVEARNESAASIAKQVADADIRLQPGRWESVMKIDRMEVSNMPAAAKAAMAEQQGATHTFTTCLTPEEAARPSAGFFQKGASGCTYDHFSMAGGRIDAEMNCKQGSGPTHMTMKGEYGGDHYAMAIKSEGEMQPGMTMDVAMTINSRRVGDCSGKAGG